MTFKTRFVSCVCGALIGLAAITGCDKADEPKKQVEKQPETKPAATQPLVNIVQAMDWCREHSMPESTCAQCNDKVAADFKAKGDWCKEHKKPESQCFECHPELKEKFAAAFKAKYGKEPPAMDADKK